MMKNIRVLFAVALIALTSVLLFADAANAQYASNTTYKTQQRRGGLPPVATSAVGLNIVEAGSYGGNFQSFGGWNGNDGSFPGGGEEQPQQQIPPQPPNTMGVYNTHNGQFMGWKGFDESWEDFFGGRSGHLMPGNELEGAYCLYQLGLGPDPTANW
jgi:hypothetical protein